MKPLNLVLPPVVQQQILAQVWYIAKDSIDNALHWEDRLRAAINSLATIPRHAVDEGASQRLGLTIHKLVFERTYLIHYRLNESASTVEILNFRHGARLPRPGEP